MSAYNTQKPLQGKHSPAEENRSSDRHFFHKSWSYWKWTVGLNESYVDGYSSEL